MAIVVQAAAAERDFCRLHDLFVEYEDDLSPELRHGVVPCVAALKQAYAGQNVAFLALESGGEAVGCAAVTMHDRETGVLRHLFVRPQKRGLGAARALVVRAIELARARRHPRLALDTQKQKLQPAYLLYRSLGFEECDAYREVDYDAPTFMELLL